MDHRGTVLLVDDNEKFISSTAPLLEKNGYACDFEYNGFAAAEKLKAKTYDVLVADIKMDGNEHLELIEEAKKHNESLPVIVITGYPTLETAIKSVGMPVTAYLVKPFEFSELLKNIDSAVLKHRLMGKIENCRMRFDEMQESLLGLETMVNEVPADQAHLPLEMYLTITTRNLIECITDMHHLLNSSRIEQKDHICQLYNCPRLDMMKRSIRDSIDVLEYTKKSFKSKELAQLRKKLQDMLSEV